jgi:protein phosphatase
MKIFNIESDTHSGKRRKNNEDCYIVRPDLGFFAVADGVGGHECGEVASFVACAKFAELLEKITNPTKEDLQNLLETVDKYVMSLAGTVDITPYETGYGMASTFTGLYFGENTYLLNVGDSRCYNFLDGKLTQVSVDQQDPDYGFLLAAVGLDILSEPDLSFTTEVKNNSGRWLLATDGLEELTEEEITECMLLPLKSCKEELIKRTLEKGARDNVTIILLE